MMIGVPELMLFVIGAISLGWYAGVIVLLYKIWQKVKHLPG